MYEKIKLVLQDDALFYSFLLILVGITAFGLGKLSVVESLAVTGEPAAVNLTTQTRMTQPDVTGGAGVTESLVASKNGTKYHLPSCPGAKQIAEQNKIFFTSANEARAAGYQPAANCPGL